MRAGGRTCRRFILGAALALVLAPAASADDQVTVVAKGLDNPRGLDVGGQGALYVTEAGRGGSGPCVTGPEGPICLGLTGAVTRVDVDEGTQARIATGLPSLADQDGRGAFGPSDVSLRGHHKGHVTIGLGIDARERVALGPAGAGMGWLYRFKKHGSLRPLADLAAFEAANNPDADQPDPDLESNPNSVDASDRKHIVVADAGGNDLLGVSKHGDISLLTVFSSGSAPAPDIPGFPVPPATPIPVDPVPTSVVRGPDGAYYVGELTGFPFVPGTANVFRVVPGSAPGVYASGLTLVTDVAFGDDGSLYVLEFATGTLLGPTTAGALIRIAPDGTREELAAGRLQAATGLVVDGDFAYVSNHGNEPGIGEVLRIRLPG